MDKRATAIIASLAVPSLIIGTDFTGTMMLVIPIEHEFSADITTTQWVLNIYALTFAMGLVTGGRLADMYGRRRLLLIGLAVFFMASIGCVAAPSVGWLIAARAVQGIGSSIVWPCILGAASAAVREDERGYAIGLIIGAVTSGNVIGPVIGGALGGLGDWRLFYVVSVVLAAVSAILVLRVVPPDDRERHHERIDYGGIAVLSMAMTALLYALDVGADWGWGSLPIIGMFAASAALFAAFPALENRVADPLVPPPMLRNRQFLLTLSTNGLLVPAMFLLFLYIPQYLHKVLGWSVMAASIGILPLMVCLAVLSVISGRLYKRMGPRLLLSAGYSLISLGAVAVVLISPAWGYLGVVPAMLLIGIGAGLSVGPAGSAAVGAADPSRAGLASGLSFMVHLSLGAIGVAGGTAILSAVTTTKLQQGLEAMGITLSATDQLKLNGSAPGTTAARDILDRFSPQIGDQITVLVQEAFITGFHRAYWLALALSIVGIFVALSLDNDKLTKMDS